MNKQLKQLEPFITANGKSCRDCVYFDESNFDCQHPSLIRNVTNKFDFDTHIVYPIASAVRVNGRCGREASLIFIETV